MKRFLAVCLLGLFVGPAIQASTLEVRSEKLIEELREHATQVIFYDAKITPNDWARLSGNMMALKTETELHVSNLQSSSFNLRSIGTYLRTLFPLLLLKMACCPGGEKEILEEFALEVQEEVYHRLPIRKSLNPFELKFGVGKIHSAYKDAFVQATPIRLGNMQMVRLSYNPVILHGMEMGLLSQKPQKENAFELIRFLVARTLMMNLFELQFFQEDGRVALPSFPESMLKKLRSLQFEDDIIRTQMEQRHHYEIKLSQTLIYKFSEVLYEEGDLREAIPYNVRTEVFEILTGKLEMEEDIKTDLQIEFNDLIMDSSDDSGFRIHDFKALLRRHNPELMTMSLESLVGLLRELISETMISTFSDVIFQNISLLWGEFQEIKNNPDRAEELEEIKNDPFLTAYYNMFDIDADKYVALKGLLTQLRGRVAKRIPSEILYTIARDVIEHRQQEFYTQKRFDFINRIIKNANLLHPSHQHKSYYSEPVHLRILTRSMWKVLHDLNMGAGALELFKTMIDETGSSYSLGQLYYNAVSTQLELSAQPTTMEELKARIDSLKTQYEESQAQLTASHGTEAFKMLMEHRKLQMKFDWLRLGALFRFNQFEDPMSVTAAHILGKNDGARKHYEDLVNEERIAQHAMLDLKMTYKGEEKKFYEHVHAITGGRIRGDFRNELVDLVDAGLEALEAQIRDALNELNAMKTYDDLFPLMASQKIGYEQRAAFPEFTPAIEQMAFESDEAKAKGFWHWLRHGYTEPVYNTGGYLLAAVVVRYLLKTIVARHPGFVMGSVAVETLSPGLFAWNLGFVSAILPQNYFEWQDFKQVKERQRVHDLFGSTRALEENFYSAMERLAMRDQYNEIRNRVAMNTALSGLIVAGMGGILTYGRVANANVQTFLKDYHALRRLNLKPQNFHRMTTKEVTDVTKALMEKTKGLPQSANQVAEIEKAGAHLVKRINAGGKRWRLDAVLDKEPPRTLFERQVRNQLRKTGMKDVFLEGAPAPAKPPPPGFGPRTPRTGEVAP